MRRRRAWSEQGEAYRSRLAELETVEGPFVAELLEVIRAYLRLEERLCKIIAIGDKYQADALESTSRLRDALERLEGLLASGPTASALAGVYPGSAGPAILEKAEGRPPRRSRDPVIERLRSAFAPGGAVSGIKPEDVAILLARWEKMDARMEKIVTISDGYQSQLRELSMRMDYMSRTDPLTGLPNRRDMMERLDREVRRFERYGTPFSVILFDVDDFKQVNDNYGHEAGDKVLRNLAEVFGRELRRTDSCARWGGEEFLVLCPEIALADARKAGEKCREAISASAVHVDSGEIHITLSGGLCSIEEGLDVDTIIRRADEALYRAKASGKDNLV